VKTGVLVKQSNDGAARQWPLLKPRVEVGRALAHDVVLSDASVSRDHAVIETQYGGWVLTDRDSRNGTRVNGVAVVRRQLNDGDLVAFGDVAMVFHIVDEEPLPAPLLAEARPGLNAGMRTIAAPEEADGSAWPGVYAWQLLKALSNIQTRPLDDYVRLAINDLSGIRQVTGSGVGLLVEPEGAWKWIWHEGADASIKTWSASEDVAAEVRAGQAVYRSHGRRVEAEDVADGAVFPISTCGRVIGCLCVQGRSVFPSALLAVFRAAAEAVGAALGLRELMTHRAAVQAAGPSVRRAPPVIVGRGAALLQVMRQAVKAAKHEATVLIRGETGTGKELFARLIVDESPRRDRPFIPVHCSAIDENLLGSMLFGHEKGAFTGAVGMKKGVFEEADGGTIFLDEIGELSLVMQVKLLRVLQEGEFMRLGGTKPMRVNVRIIAATNRDLEKGIKSGRFREDLFYRLNVIALTLPPLRERREDIPELVRHYAETLSRETARGVCAVSPEALARLQGYGWPGNIRELRNVVERGLVLAENGIITEDDLPPEVALKAEAGAGPAEEQSLERMERDHILAVLAECGGNKRLAAERLGISRSTLYEKLKET
jgi:DNA-binding NtrC family response regulator